MNTQPEFNSQDLVFRMLDGAHKGSLFPVSTQKCLMGDNNGNGANLVILRGPNGAAIQSHGAELLINGNSVDCEWLKLGDHIQFGQTLIEVVQVGAFGTSESTETSGASDSHTETTAHATCSEANHVEITSDQQACEAQPQPAQQSQVEAVEERLMSAVESQESIHSCDDVEPRVGLLTDALASLTTSLTESEGPVAPMQDTQSLSVDACESLTGSEAAMPSVNEQACEEPQQEQIYSPLENMNAEPSVNDAQPGEWSIPKTEPASTPASPESFQTPAAIEEPETQPAVENAAEQEAIPTENDEDADAAKAAAREAELARVFASLNAPDPVAPETEAVKESATPALTPEPIVNSEPVMTTEPQEIVQPTPEVHVEQACVNSCETPCEDPANCPTQMESAESELSASPAEGLASINDISQQIQTGFQNTSETPELISEPTVASDYSLAESIGASEIPVVPSLETQDQESEAEQKLREVFAEFKQNTGMETTESVEREVENESQFASALNAEAQPEPQAEAEPGQPKAEKSSESVADILARMQLEVPADDEASTDESNASSAQPIADPATESIAEPVAPTPEPPADSGDEASVEDYMNRLLGRSGEEVVAQEEAKVEQEKVEAAKAAKRAEPVQLLTPSEYKPANSAPEKTKNLDAFRELANQNNRVAIAKSNSQRVKTVTLTNLGVMALGLLLAIYLFVSAGGQSLNMVLSGITALLSLGLGGWAAKSYLNHQKQLNS